MSVPQLVDGVVGRAWRGLAAKLAAWREQGHARVSVHLRDNITPSSDGTPGYFFATPWPDLSSAAAPHVVPLALYRSVLSRIRAAQARGEADVVAAELHVIRPPSATKDAWATYANAMIPRLGPGSVGSGTSLCVARVDPRTGQVVCEAGYGTLDVDEAGSKLRGGDGAARPMAVHVAIVFVLAPPSLGG